MGENVQKRLYLLILISSLLTSSAFGAGYQRATEDKDNVKRKLFTKSRKLELSLPSAGLILNQSFIETFLIHGGLTYFSSESWGWGVEAALGLNVDKSERECLENFYNDPNDRVDAECGDGSDLTDDGETNFGPAYMPIREINYIIAANAVWNPVYGKQIVFLSATSYFDVFLTMGAGLAFSDYYEQRTELNNGEKPRADYTDGRGLSGGASKDETDSYGEAGRPEPLAQTHPLINLGLGQKFHFWKRFSMRFEFRDMILLGTPGGFENLFALWGGVGMRF